VPLTLEPSSASIVLLAASQCFTVFSTMMPDRTEIRDADPSNEGMAGDMRHGEIVSSLLTLAFGTFLSYLTKSSLPIWIGAASCITMITTYEVTRLRVAP